VRHPFRGKRWRIVWASIERIAHLAGEEAKRTGDPSTRTLGLCDAPNTKHKTIHMAEGQSPLCELDTAIHEGLHACMWDLDEEAVADSARDLARFLWRLGYRRTDKP